MATTSARRTPSIFILSILADFAAISYLPFAFVDIRSAITARDFAIGLGLAFYGFSRLGASYGLRQLKPFGALLEQMSAVVWIACAIYAALRLEVEIALIFVPGVAVAIFALVYLNRPVIRPLFAGPGLPFNFPEMVGLLVVAVLVSVITLRVSPAKDHQIQSRTMASMQEIASAWESRATDFNRYNAAAVTFPTTGVTSANLAMYLAPTYIKVLPQDDGWGHSWQFGIDQPWAAKNAAQVYVIVSYGKDGRSQGRWEGGETTDFDCDIVYSNGTFLQYPQR